MKAKTLIISLIALTLITCLFSGCLGNNSNNKDDKIVGTWKNSIFTVTFNADNTYSVRTGIYGMNGTWEESGGIYVLYDTDGDLLCNVTFVGKNVSVDGDFVPLSNEFTKQK